MGSVVGTIPGWATLVVLLAGVWTISHGGGGAAVSELKAANEVLTSRVHNLNDEKNSLVREVAELRGRTDIAAALVPVLEWTVKHETRAQERHEQSTTILGLLAERLGPDRNGHAE